ncbi:sugar ABC transporter substrate-binding protein [Nocardioides humi]|uniref:Periplasmic binding protein domain-containing protein n=1 Tax=Nocardioides humi TaxID=449461 RepID=A0ABN2BI40_9ACTN|nr:substrate-binding domain-containing protein [Nocardioides humi]
MQFTKHARRMGVALVMAVTLSVATACGSSGDDEGSEVSAADLDAVRAFMEPFYEQPTEIPNKTPIDKPIPTGKNIVFIGCGTSTCNLEADIIEQATDALGWGFSNIANDGTPEKVKAAWAQILRTKPDGVIYSATDRAVFDQELRQAAEAGIQVVACCTTDEPDDALKYVIVGSEQNFEPGQLMAGYLIDQSDGKGDAVWVDVSAFKILQPLREGFEQTYEKYCPDCKVDVIDIPVTALGKDVPDRIVGYLRANPNVKNVGLSIDGALGAGLPAALKAAGLNDIRVIGDGPDENTLQYIDSGQQSATVTFPYYEAMFAQVDALARLFAGVPLEDTSVIPNWVVTKETLPTASEIFPVVEDVKEQYFKLWGVN